MDLEYKNEKKRIFCIKKRVVSYEGFFKIYVYDECMYRFIYLLFFNIRNLI